jgi:hypothetical protein
VRARGLSPELARAPGPSAQSPAGIADPQCRRAGEVPIPAQNDFMAGIASGEIDTEAKKQKLREAYAEELLKRSPEWENLQVSLVAGGAMPRRLPLPLCCLGRFESLLMDDDRRMIRNALVEIYHVLVHEPDASGRCRLADRGPFGRSVETV